MPKKKSKDLASASRAAKKARKGVPTLEEMAPHWKDDDCAVTYLIGVGVLTIPTCKLWGRQCRKEDGKKFTYRCRCRGRTTRYSILHKTFFKNQRVGLAIILQVLYFFAVGANNTQVRQFVAISNTTIAQYLKYCRQLVAQMVLAREGVSRYRMLFSNEIPLFPQNLCLSKKPFTNWILFHT